MIILRWQWLHYVIRWYLTATNATVPQETPSHDLVKALALPRATIAWSFVICAVLTCMCQTAHVHQAHPDLCITS